MDGSLGIDVGLSGAVAWVASDGSRCRVFDVPVILNGKRREYDIKAFSDLLRSLGENLSCYLEQSSSRPGQGVVSVFKFGVGYGVAQALVIAAGHRLSLIRPQTWKRAMLRDLAKTKQASCIRAAQLFPEAPLLGPRGGAKDGRAEALLLAEFCRRETYGPWRP